MALKGIYDSAFTIKGWFDSDSTASGWLDQELADAGAGVTVIPATAFLSLTSFAPTVPVVVTPTTVSLVSATFAPQIPSIVIPSTASLVLTSFAPTIPQGVLVIPDAVALVTTTFAPIIPSAVTPSPSAMSFTTFAPQVEGSAPESPPIGGGGGGGSYWWTNKPPQRPVPRNEPTSPVVGDLLPAVFFRFRMELSGFVSLLETEIVRVRKVKARPQVKEIKVKAKLKSTGELNVLVPLPRFSFTGSVGIQGTVNLSARIRQLRFTGSVPSVVKEYNGIRFYNDDSLSFDVPEGYEVSVIIIPAGAEEYLDVPLSIPEYVNSDNPRG